MGKVSSCEVYHGEQGQAPSPGTADKVYCYPLALALGQAVLWYSATACPRGVLCTSWAVTPKTS